MHLAVRKKARYEIIGHHLSFSFRFCQIRINEKKTLQKVKIWLKRWEWKLHMQEGVKKGEEV